MNVSVPAPRHEVRFCKRLFLVDDQPAFTTLLKLGLERTGYYQVESCNDPHLAFRKALEFEPDAILLDVVMPGMDGGDLYAQFQKHSTLRRIPTIMVTALVSSCEVSRSGFVSRGGMLLMSKPVAVPRLHHCLSLLFEGCVPGSIHSN